jgi:hypothetical protein
MTLPDRLDFAIDHVASRMVAVPDDGEMTLRIVSALPERTSRLRWLMPQLAAIGAIVIAALVWTTRNESSREIAMLPSSPGTSMIGLANPIAAAAPGTALRTMPLERLELLERLEPLEGDHERSLLPIEAVAALVVPSMSPVEIPATELLTIAPIAVSDLPMTAESFSQQK